MFLSESELVELTGLKYPKSQYKFLLGKGYTPELTSKGRVRLLRDAVIQRQMPAGRKTSTQRTRPNLEKLSEKFARS